MAFISVFDVLGPNMIGPSSSHTAGAAAISFLARKMIAPPIVKVEFTLYGSFAKTYQGHGTDRALLGGLMGFETDDTRIRNSFQIAQDRGLDYRFTPCTTETEVHPNTVDIRMENAAGRVMTVRVWMDFDADPGELDLYYIQSPGEDYDKYRRVWAVRQDDGSYLYTLPRTYIHQLRLDPGSAENLGISIQKIRLNEPAGLDAYFDLSLNGLFRLAVWPALAAAVLAWLTRLWEEAKQTKTQKDR